MEKFAVMGNIFLAFERARERFFPQLGWLLLPMLVLIPISVVLGLVFGTVIDRLILSFQLAVFSGNPSFLALGGGVFIALLVYALVMVLFFSWYGIYASRIGTKAMLSEPLLPGEARQRGFNRMLSSLLVNIVIGLAYIAAILILVFIISLLASLGGFGAFLSAVLVIAFVVLSFYVSLGLMVVIPIMANEGLGFVAISRSWDLANGHRWQLLGYNLMWLLIMFAAYLGVFILIFVSGLLASASAASAVLSVALIIVVCAVFVCGFIVVTNLMGPAAYLGLLKANGESMDGEASVFL